MKIKKGNIILNFLNKLNFDNCKIKVNSETSSLVQKKLFELGYKWLCGSKDIQHIYKPFLYIYSCNYFIQDDSEEFFNNHQFREININDLGITNPNNNINENIYTLSSIEYFKKFSNKYTRINMQKDKLQDRLTIPTKIRNNWISVKDKLPPKNTVVLAYFPKGNEAGKKIFTTFYYNGDLTDFGSSISYCFKASHWMELPQPPEKDIISTK